MQAGPLVAGVRGGVRPAKEIRISADFVTVGLKVELSDLGFDGSGRSDRACNRPADRLAPAVAAAVRAPFARPAVDRAYRYGDLFRSDPDGSSFPPFAFGDRKRPYRYAVPTTVRIERTSGELLRTKFKRRKQPKEELRKARPPNRQREV
jgi:hypothetical protein